MSIKRFVAADMRRAMELVKQEMGPDAIILSSTRIKEGVEIVTSDDANYQSVADPQSLPSAFSSATRSQEPSGQSFNRHLDSALSQSNTQNTDVSSAGGQKDFPHRPLMPESPSLLDKFRKKQSKSQFSESESGLSAFEYYNGKAQNTVDISPSSKESLSENGFVPPFHLASMQYEPGNTNIHFDLDKTHFSSIKSHVEMAEIIDERSELTEVDSFLDEQFGQLRSEILEMREMLRQQIATKSHSVTNNAENKVTFIKGGDPLLKIITKRLKNLGLPDSEIKKCLSTVDISPLTNNKTKDLTNALDKMWSAILADIAHRLTSDNIKTPQRNVPINKAIKKVSVFIGLSGAGKMDTIGKFATQQVIDEGSDSLVIISLEKNGLNLQQENKLDRLSQILSVQHFIVSDVNDMTSIINHVKKGVKVFINLPSIAYDKKIAAGELLEASALSETNEQAEIIGDLKAGLKTMSSNHNVINLNTFFVVSANTPKIIVNDFFNDKRKTSKQTFLKLIDKCIVTQLDQLESITKNTFGCLLGYLLSANLPVSHITNGANLPHYLQTARGFQLVTTAVQLMKKSIQQKNIDIKNQLNVSRVNKISSGKSIRKEVDYIQADTFNDETRNSQAEHHNSQTIRHGSKTISSVATLKQVAAP